MSSLGENFTYILIWPDFVKKVKYLLFINCFFNVVIFFLICRLSLKNFNHVLKWRMQADLSSNICFILLISSEIPCSVFISYFSKSFYYWFYTVIIMVFRFLCQIPEDWFFSIFPSCQTAFLNICYSVLHLTVPLTL